MTEYLINVAITFSGFVPGLVGIALIFIVIHILGTKFAGKNKNRKWFLFNTFSVIAGLALVGSAISTSNTYKTEHNRTAHDNRIEQVHMIESREEHGPVINRALQPKHSVPERQDHFDQLTDWKKFAND